MTPVESRVTGRERVVAAYKGGFADCVPAYPIASVNTARSVNPGDFINWRNTKRSWLGGRSPSG